MRTATRYALAIGCILLAVGWFVWRRTAAPPPQPKRATSIPPPQPVEKPAPSPAPQLEAAAAKPKQPVPAKPTPPLSPPAQPLANPPSIIKAVYFTGWSAGLKRRVDYLVDLHKTTAINAVVIDVKDYSGNIAYAITAPEARQYGAVRVMIRDFDGLVNRLHREGVYVIARLTVFQDPVLAEARPDLAVHRVSKLSAPAAPQPQHLAPKQKPGPLTAASVWRDRKGLAWIDPASRPAWDYVVAIARDARAHGVDELNFDYVRFPSDGDLNDMYFPNWDGKTPKHEVIRQFFRYLRQQLGDTRISADLFGLATVNNDDLGIGQVIEDALGTFDSVCPMVYPSHYAHKFLGFPNPAQHPYEVVNYSMKEARARLEDFSHPKPPPAAKGGVASGKGDGTASASGRGDGPTAASAKGDGVAPAPRQAEVKAANLRPWIQDFNLGAKYDAAMVKAEIKAVEDALGDRFAGYMVWAPSNVYTRQALVEPPKKTETAEAHPAASAVSH